MASEEDEIIVRADEVDEEGADVSTLTATTDAELTSQVEERSQHKTDLSTSGTTADRLGSPTTSNIRPILRREGSIPPPPPPKQPPPPAPADAATPNDSLSLAQLRNIVSNFQKGEPTAYAYTYEDTRTFAEELEEWFQYTQDERAGLRAMRAAFEAETSRGPGLPVTHSWESWPEAQRQFLLSTLKAKIGDAKPQTSLRALEALAYLVLGCWKTNGGKGPGPEGQEKAEFDAPNEMFSKSFPHIKSLRSTVLQLAHDGALEMVFTAFMGICSEDRASDLSLLSDSADDANFWSSSLERRMDVILTILYAFVEVGRWEMSKTKGQSIRDAFIALRPSFLGLLSQQSL